MHRTKVDAALAASEQAHEDDPERAELLRRARRFKASWIDLAESLTVAGKAAAGNGGAMPRSRSTQRASFS